MQEMHPYLILKEWVIASNSLVKEWVVWAWEVWVVWAVWVEWVEWAVQEELVVCHK